MKIKVRFEKNLNGGKTSNSWKYWVLASLFIQNDKCSNFIFTYVRWVTLEMQLPSKFDHVAKISKTSFQFLASFSHFFFAMTRQDFFSIDKVFHVCLDEDTPSFCSSRHTARVHTMQHNIKWKYSVSHTKVDKVILHHWCGYRFLLTQQKVLN